MAATLDAGVHHNFTSYSKRARTVDENLGAGGELHNCPATQRERENQIHHTVAEVEEEQGQVGTWDHLEWLAAGECRAASRSAGCLQECPSVWGDSCQPWPTLEKGGDQRGDQKKGRGIGARWIELGNGGGPHLMEGLW